MRPSLHIRSWLNLKFCSTLNSATALTLISFLKLKNKKKTKRKKENKNTHMPHQEFFKPEQQSS
jgi:hypothetical protein